MVSRYVASNCSIRCLACLALTSVSFADRCAAISSTNAPSYPIFWTAVSPAGTGAVGVTVTTGGGSSNPQTFTYIPPPTIATTNGLVPNFGPTSGGTSVVITGTGFTTATAVSFGTTAATFTCHAQAKLRDPEDGFG